MAAMAAIEDNKYITDKLYQKLYQLNVIHDMDHDFSTTKFADRLAKIGKRIHNTALALGVYPQGQGGGDRDSAVGTLIENNTITNDIFVKLFINRNISIREVVSQDGSEYLKPITGLMIQALTPNVYKHLDNLILSHEQYKDDIFNKGVTGVRIPESSDNYKEGDILIDRIKLNDLAHHANTRSKVLKFSKYIINCNDYIDFHTLNNIDLYAHIRIVTDVQMAVQQGEEELEEENSRPELPYNINGGDGNTLVAQRPPINPPILNTSQSQPQGPRMTQQMFDQLRKANEQRQKEIEERKKIERYKNMIKNNLITKEEAEDKIQSEGLDVKLLDDTDSDSDSDSDSESNHDVAAGKTKTQEKITSSIADDKTEFSAQQLTLKEKKLISVTNVLNYKISKTKGPSELKLLNEYYRMQLDIIITLSAIGYTDDVFSLISSNEYRSISFLSVLYLFYSKDASSSGFKEVLNDIYINPHIESTNDNMKGGNGPPLTPAQLISISKKWLNVTLSRDSDGNATMEERNELDDSSAGKTAEFFPDEPFGKISDTYKNIPWNEDKDGGEENPSNFDKKIQYIKYKIDYGSLADIKALLEDFTDGEFYTDNTFVPDEKKKADGTLDPDKLKLLDRLVYKLNQIKKTMVEWSGDLAQQGIQLQDWHECTQLYNYLVTSFSVIMHHINNTNTDADGHGYNKYYPTDGRPVLGKSTFTERYFDDFFNAIVLGGSKAGGKRILGFQPVTINDNNTFITEVWVFFDTKKRVTDELIIPGVGKFARHLESRNSLGRIGKLDELDNAPLCQQNWIGFFQKTEDSASKGWVMTGKNSYENIGDLTSAQVNPLSPGEEALGLYIDDLIEEVTEEGAEVSRGGFYWPGVALNVEDACRMYYYLHFKNISPDWRSWHTRTIKRAVNEMCIEKVDKLIKSIEIFFFQNIYQTITNRYYDLKYEIKKKATAAAAAHAKQEAAERAEAARLQRLSEKFADGKGLSPEGKDLANNVTTLLTRGGLISTGVCTIRQDGSPELSEWAKDCVGRAVEQQRPQGPQAAFEPDNTNYQTLINDNPLKKKCLFQSLIGLEIYCLWSIAFPNSDADSSTPPPLKQDWDYAFVRSRIPGNGTLDDRLLTGTVAILNKFFTPGQQTELGMFLTSHKVKQQTQIMWGSRAKRWIINNASQMEYVNDNLVHKDNTVCVIPSIADGMSQCYSYDSAGQESRYIYNMKYSLQNTEQDEYYEGIIKLANSDGSVVKYIGNIALSNRSGLDMSVPPTTIDTFFLNLKLNLNNATQLQANEVYKVMLTKLELIFKDYYSQQNPGYTLEELWGYIAEDRSPGSKFMEFAQIMMVKGMGDIFQEAAATLKWGGQSDVDGYTSNDNNPPDTDYPSPPTDASRILMNWVNGNMIRLGAMGDQPSGFRPAMINLLSNLNLWNNKRVNTQNLSGYITDIDDKSLMVLAKPLAAAAAAAAPVAAAAASKNTKRKKGRTRTGSRKRLQVTKGEQKAARGGGRTRTKRKNTKTRRQSRKRLQVTKGQQKAGKKRRRTRKKRKRTRKNNH